jgi:hypothetical protein
VQERKKQNVETKCEVSDLLRAKIMYTSLDHLKKAVSVVNLMCNKNEYDITSMEDRLNNKQTRDVVFKIQIELAVCELQLAMKQDKTQYHWTHSIYEIERSPLGCIFACYSYMTKGIKLPLLENCKLIKLHLQNAKNQEEQETLAAATYIVDCLNTPPDV